MTTTIFDALGWEIRSKSIQEIADLRLKIAMYIGLFEEQIRNAKPSTVTLKKVETPLAEMEKALQEFRRHRSKLNAFDRLVYDDMASTATAMRAFIRYVTVIPPKKEKHKHWNFSSQFLTPIFGPGVFSYIAERAKAFNDRAQDRYDFISDSIMGNCYSVDILPVRRILRSHLDTLITDSRGFIEQYGFVPPDVTFDLLPFEQHPQARFDKTSLIATYSLAGGSDCSQWDDSVSHIMIQADGEMERGPIYYRDTDGSFKIYSLCLRTAILHELGHAFNALYTLKYMPMALTQCSIHDNSNLTKGCVAEAVALTFDQFGAAWISEQRKALNLTKPELTLMHLERQLYEQDDIYQALYDILEMRKNFQKKGEDDVGKMMVRITGKAVFEADSNGLSGQPIMDQFDTLNYKLGLRLSRKVLRRAKTLLGTGRFYRNRQIVLIGFLLGGWRPDTFERFYFDEYLPRVQPFLKP